MLARAAPSKLSLPPTFLAPCLSRGTPIRHASSSTSAAKTRLPIPPPTPFVPDVQTFMSLIGRQMSTHASKIPSWEALFTLTSDQLRESGVDPPRARRYLLWWRDRFRRGLYGIGGDLQYVHDGIAEVRVKESEGGKKKKIVNVQMADADAGKAMSVVDADGPSIKGVKIAGAQQIQGSHFTPVKGSMGSAARIKRQEGLWEVKRGRKIHGGERRRKNVLSRIAAKERGTLK